MKRLEDITGLPTAICLSYGRLEELDDWLPLVVRLLGACGNVESGAGVGSLAPRENPKRSPEFARWNVGRS